MCVVWFFFMPRDRSATCGFLPGHENSTKIRELKPKKGNVELKATVAKSIENYRKQQAVQAVSLRNIGAGERQCVH